jgi:hypothetical protein
VNGASVPLYDRFDEAQSEPSTPLLRQLHGIAQDRKNVNVIARELFACQDSRKLHELV